MRLASHQSMWIAAALLAVMATSSSAFTPAITQRTTALRSNILPTAARRPFKSISLFAESDPSASSRETRKRKRKVPRDEQQPSSSSATPAVEATTSAPRIQRPKDVPVELRVQNVKKMMGGDTEELAPPTASNNPLFSNPFQKQSTPTSDARSSIKSSSSLSSNSGNDALKQLLIDAQQMQSSESLDPASSGGSTNPIRNILSTIVTADFFVVCAFLVWFLAGIFCSSVLKDDTVQIAFNSNFQAFVQPALGVLMIASVASAVVGNEDDPNQQ